MRKPTTFQEFNEPLERRIVTGLERLGTVMRHHSWREGFAQELTPTQGQALLYLERFGMSTLGALAESLGIRPSTASEAVVTLEEKGLVIRQRAVEDRRRLEIHLTAAGRESAAQAGRWPHFLLRTVADLEVEEQALLLRLLQKMIRELQESGALSVARMCATCQHFRPFAHPGEESPHHCAYVDLPFGDRELRLECPEHEPAPPAEARRNWARLTRAS